MADECLKIRDPEIQKKCYEKRFLKLQEKSRPEGIKEYWEYEKERQESMKHSKSELQPGSKAKRNDASQQKPEIIVRPGIGFSVNKLWSDAGRTFYSFDFGLRLKKRDFEGQLSYLPKKKDGKIGELTKFIGMSSAILFKVNANRFKLGPVIGVNKESNVCVREMYISYEDCKWDYNINKINYDICSTIYSPVSYESTKDKITFFFGCKFVINHIVINVNNKGAGLGLSI